MLHNGPTYWHVEMKANKKFKCYTDKTRPDQTIFSQRQGHHRSLQEEKQRAIFAEESYSTSQPRQHMSLHGPLGINDSRDTQLSQHTTCKEQALPVVKTKK